MNKEKSFAVASRRERGFEKSEAKARLTLWALALASNPQKRNFIILDCYASLRFARNDRYKKQNRTRCAPHGDDNIFCNFVCNDKNFQFDKFQRLLSVIYKKNSLTKEISK